MITRHQRFRPRIAAKVTVLGLLLPAISAISATSHDTPLFEKDIRPILKTHCFQCHGEEEELEGDLDVRLRRFLEKGGESGPAIVPGNPAESHLLELLKKGEMPKKKSKLADAEIAIIERWIADGAPTARPEPEKLGPEYLFTDEERAWWSLQPVMRPAVPPIDNVDTKNGNAIDAFIQRKLSANKLAFSKEASPATLVRRATFDLTGLPPAPEEVEAFVRDYEAARARNGETAKRGGGETATVKNIAGSPARPLADSGQEAPRAQAILENLVARLLDSPAYGERWGRHWLDVAGYADSDGYSADDPERKHAWRYRDYVIRSFNEDKPFDAFVREQLAGDEIAAAQGLHADSPTEAERIRYADLVVATGFLRMAPDGTGIANDVTSQNACISDTMKILGTALYGMTIGCAECHDHRYDPISQADYYRLRAVFEPGFDTKKWRTPPARLVSLQTKEDAAESGRIEDEAKKLDAARLEKQEQFISEVLEKLLAERDESIRDDLRAAYRADPKARTPEQTKLLKANPSVNNLSAGSLYLYDSTYKTKNADTLKKMAAEAAEVRKAKPAHEYAQAFTELPVKPDAIPVTYVFHRGDPESPKDPVKPGDLSVLAAWRDVAVPENTGAIPSTGRRLAYANAITDGRHPLLARVIVNRVWMHHFGRGLVASAGDLGALGDPPSHPELLDWLACEFMESGWSLKELHRLILTSRAWQQESRRDEHRERVDPDNRLLSRQNVRRLEAETLRDALLAVSGKLNAKHYGEPVPVMHNEEGQVVIGEDTTDSAGRQTGKFIPLEGEEFRRSIYVQIRRTRPLEMFAAFDAPDMMNPNCEVRPLTTVSPQSLLLMNSAAMREHASHFAARLESGRDDLPGRIDLAWRLAYGRAPSEEERAAAIGFVNAQVDWYRNNPARFEVAAGPAANENAAPELLGLGALCHALISANEFLYVD